MFSLVFSMRNLREQEGKGRTVVSICCVGVGGKGEEDPEVSGVFSLVFLILSSEFFISSVVNGHYSSLSFIELVKLVDFFRSVFNVFG